MPVETDALNRGVDGVLQGDVVKRLQLWLGEPAGYGFFPRVPDVRSWLHGCHAVEPEARGIVVAVLSFAPTMSCKDWP